MVACPVEMARWTRFERVAFAFGGHPPGLGSSVAGPAHVRRDEEIETAAGHIGDPSGVSRTIVEFRAGGAPVDVFGLAHAPSFLRAICLIPLVRNSEIRHEHLVPRYQQKCKQNGRLPWTFTCGFNAPRKFYENQKLNYRSKLLLSLMFSIWCPWPESNRRKKGPFPVLSWGVTYKWPRHDVLRGGRLNDPAWSPGLLRLRPNALSLQRSQCLSEPCSRRVTPQRNRNELGETTVNKTCRKRTP